MALPSSDPRRLTQQLAEADQANPDRNRFIRAILLDAWRAAYLGRAADLSAWPIRLREAFATPTLPEDVVRLLSILDGGVMAAQSTTLAASDAKARAEIGSRLHAAIMEGDGLQAASLIQIIIADAWASAFRRDAAGWPNIWRERLTYLGAARSNLAVQALDGVLEIAANAIGSGRVSGANVELMRAQGNLTATLNAAPSGSPLEDLAARIECEPQTLLAPLEELVESELVLVFMDEGVRHYALSARGLRALQLARE